MLELNVDEDNLYERIAGAAGAQYTNKVGQTAIGQNPNRYWAHNNGAGWVGDFAERMSQIITSEFDSFKEQLITNDKTLVSLDSLKVSVEKTLNEQRLAIQRQQKAFLNYQKQEQTRLNILWWSEALYSSSQKKSYRSYQPEVASVLMPYDLLEEIQTPSPASVAFTLSEALSKLPECGHNRDYSFYEILTKIRNERTQLDLSLLDELVSSPRENSSNIRDIIIQVLTDEHCDLDSLIERSFIPQEWRCSLPELSRAIFRQEQAYRLVMEA
ncbi:GTPase-associated system all-helical protein GASH [Vibrio owensii]|uniref:GTPase-associated system all-helical protein GASH n=1 Tax=Vibrio owensii TaxID=696485 RepID=UPI0038CE583A